MGFQEFVVFMCDRPAVLDSLAKNGDAYAMRYDGGKGTTYPQIINLMPPHRRYIESHLGGGAVMRHKRAAEEQIGIEIDQGVIASYGHAFTGICSVVNASAINWLSSESLDQETLVYVDPPYHPDTRRRARVYKHDYTVDDHQELLNFLCRLPAKVMVSGYDCPLYREHLSSWNQHRFFSQSHSGLREESIWFNFAPPVVLHDDRYLGQGFRQREVIRRRQHRLKDRLLKLSPSERASIHSWLGENIEQGQVQ